MYNIIPLLLILISLSAIIIILIRKFPALANLNVDAIPAEKEAKIKQQILSSRLKRNIIKWNTKFIKIFKPVTRLINNFFRWTFQKLNDLKDSYKNEEIISPDNIEKSINKLFIEAEELERQNDLKNLEKKYIEIIGIDSRNIKAFKALAKLYFIGKNFEEAKQTYEHILKLKDDDEEVYDNLAQIAKEKGNYKQAKDDYLKVLNLNNQKSQTYFDLALINKSLEEIGEAEENIKKAINFEPANPRYLDTLLEISIIKKDKNLALNTYNKLLKVNPDNNKLIDFKKQIDIL